MKIIVIDTSHNSSLQKVKAFLNRHSDADIIYTFDYMYCEYSTVDDLISDLEELPEEFFSKPSAYYDVVVSILGKVRKLPAETIIIYSPQIDECSRLSSEYLYDCNIEHFERYHPGILDINYSAMVYTPQIRVPAFKSPFKNFFQRLSRWDPFSLDNENDDYDDYYSAG
ncbi:MAG: hypothetical protein J6M44_09505 [Butyrivibrio sp.]|nr:hypothetical protein [Butyrivibrio sp.]